MPAGKLGKDSVRYIDICGLFRTRHHLHYEHLAGKWQLKQQLEAVSLTDINWCMSTHIHRSFAVTVKIHC